MKILPKGADLFHVDGRMDGQTDMTKLIVAFRNFANALTNGGQGKMIQQYRLKSTGLGYEILTSYGENG